MLQLEIQLLKGIDKLHDDNLRKEHALKYFNSLKKDLIIRNKPTYEIVTKIPRILEDVTRS